jgi:hypothetical protein
MFEGRRKTHGSEDLTFQLSPDVARWIHRKGSYKKTFHHEMILFINREREIIKRGESGEKSVFQTLRLAHKVWEFGHDCINLHLLFSFYYSREGRNVAYVGLKPFFQGLSQAFADNLWVESLYKQPFEIVRRKIKDIGVFLHV